MIGLTFDLAWRAMARGLRRAGVTPRHHDTPAPIALMALAPGPWYRWAWPQSLEAQDYDGR
jgi:hypothetical protein